MMERPEQTPGDFLGPYEIIEDETNPNILTIYVEGRPNVLERLPNGNVSFLDSATDLPQFRLNNIKKVAEEHFQKRAKEVDR